MFRIRWFIVNLNNCYSQVIDGILSDNYSEDKNYGFKSFSKKENILDAAYIKKKVLKEDVVKCSPKMYHNAEQKCTS